MGSILKSRAVRWAAAAAVFCLFCTGIYFFPPVHQRLAWRLASLQTSLHYFLNPPDQAVFVPKNPSAVEIQSTLGAVETARIASPAPTYTPTALPASLPTLIPSPSPTPLPAQVLLKGIRYQYQSFNNCGPANLAMALSYWGWEGSQNTTKAALRPNEDDANVMPAEMAAYAAAQPRMKAVLHVGGSLELLKRFLAGGFPVVVEMGHQPKKDWWMGHYVVINGYDDAAARLTAQDSLVMPDLPIPYAEIEESWWRDFNRVFLVVYPSEREAEVLSILGPDADPTENLRRALETARQEAARLTGRDLFFAYFNQGDTLLALGDTRAAADAYDIAFTLYRAIDEKQRPWRTLWYRSGPYQAYFMESRYQDVIDLSNSVLSMLSKRGLEESHYWRGQAYAALNEPDKAIFDYQIALKLRPGYELAQQALERSGGK